MKHSNKGLEARSDFFSLVIFNAFSSMFPQITDDLTKSQLHIPRLRIILYDFLYLCNTK